jgi:hypothetical protein
MIFVVPDRKRPSDRNLMDLYADVGLGLWDKRPGDSFGLAASYSQLPPV